MRLFFFTSILLVCLGISPITFAQTETKAAHDARMQWWRDARFGMFIHWGLYAVPAGEWNGKTGYGEWIRNSAQIPLDVYDQFRQQFNPVRFNATDWVHMAKEAGMKYIVITSKHHDGFCMFNTRQTDFSIMSTPFNWDPMKDLADACRKEGIRMCFYYSIMDWHHPDYLPRRDWETTRTTDGADFSRYLDYMKAELKELLENYGDIGVLWFDGEWERTWNARYGKEIYEYCRSIQPDVIINNRIGAGRIELGETLKDAVTGGDFGTPEQEIPATGLPGMDWETCMTMNDHWGYNSHDKNFKSSKELIRMLADIASKGGNYLLNVGPTPAGDFPPESIDRLAGIARWMKINGEAIHGTQASPFKSLAFGRCTRKETSAGTRLYLHVFDWPADHKLILPGCLNTPKQAFLLADEVNGKLNVARQEDALIVSLTAGMPDPINTVVVLDLEGKLDLTTAPEFKSDFDVFTDSLVVQLVTDRDNVKIHYTLDGSIPSLNSLEYHNPLMITKSTLITARCFRDEKPVSGISKKEFRKVIPKKALKLKDAKPGIGYSLYEGSWDSIPDLAKLKSTKEGILDRISFTPRTKDEYFCISYSGYVLIPLDDVYRFIVGSDDGSRLYIDGVPVVENDGLHAMVEKEGVTALDEGYHKFRLDFFNKTGAFELKVFLQNSKMQKQEVQAGMLFY